MVYLLFKCDFLVGMYEINGIIVSNIISPPCFQLLRLRGYKLKTTKLIAGIRSSRGSSRESEP